MTPAKLAELAAKFPEVVAAFPPNSLLHEFALEQAEQKAIKAAAKIVTQPVAPGAPEPAVTAPSQKPEPVTAAPIIDAAPVTAVDARFATPLAGALTLAAMGIPQIPVRAGTKKAFLDDWQNLATTDAAQIEAWAKQYNCNFGSVAKAEIGGFWFLELDENGLAKRIADEEQRPLPDTLLVRSRPGRGHLYFRQNAASIAMGNITQPQVKGAGFSVRVKNEYVVSAGSFRLDLNRSYEPVVITDVVECPQWLIDWIQAQRVTANPKSSVVAEAIANKTPLTEGKRNTMLYKIACKWRGDGLTDEEILDALHRYNEENCDPPLPKDEVESCARSAATKPQGDPARDVVIINSTPNPLAGIQQVVEEQPKEWGTPEEINDGLSPVLPFDITFVPNCMQAFAMDTAALMSVPLDFTGVTILAALAGCTNRRAFVYPRKLNKKWREAIAISGALVASSGELKTPTFRAITNILSEKEAEWRKAHKGEMDKYDAAVKLVKEQNKKLKQEEAPLLDLPEKPAPTRRLVANDATPERLHQVMAEYPVGIFVSRDELSGWIAELDMKGREGQRSLFLAAMNGDDAHSVDRIGRDDEFAIMSLSIYGGIQPPLLVDFMNDQRNVWDGTLARLGLLVYPDEVFLPTIDRIPNENAYLMARKVFRTLAEMGPKQILLSFDDDAQTVFNQWFEELRLRIRDEKHPGKKSHISKYRGLLPKLAGLLQLADLVGSLPSGVLARDDGDTAAAITGAHYIDVGHLQRAIKLLSYLESHMHRVYGCNRTPNQRAVFALAAHIRRCEVRDGFTVRDVFRKRWADLGSTDLAEGAILTLEDMGWLREKIADTSGRGRPTQRWEINPAVGRVAA